MVLAECSETLPHSGSMRSGRVSLRESLELHTNAIACGSSLPTPTASSYGTRNNGKRGDGSTFKTAGAPSLSTMARRDMWPTPTVKGNYARAGRHPDRPSKEGNGLATEVWIQTGTRGPLNPRWVEWLMGWPMGATGCEPLETDKFRSWLRSQRAALLRVLGSTGGLPEGS